jgi:DNA (cytosine-5)-methyltransferase 1
LNYIDLFAGCGGLSLGLHQAGLKGLFAIEKSDLAFKTLEHNLIKTKKHFNWPDWLPQQHLDINKVLKDYKENLIALRGKVDLVTGGPPCQGFSSAGRRKENDVRNGLIRSYLKFIMYVQPKIIFFENVKGFTLEFKKNKSTKARGHAYSAFVVEMLERLGYEVEGNMIDFSEYGVPQKRTRFILVGIKKNIQTAEGKQKPRAGAFFEALIDNKVQFLKQKKLTQCTNLGQAIGDLLKANGLVDTPDRKRFFSGVYASKRVTYYQAYLRLGFEGKSPDSHSFPKHSREVEKRFKTLLATQRANKNISKKARERHNIKKNTIIPLSAKKQAPTITTLPDDYIHYLEPRILTVREYARIQSFPDWFEFRGKYTTGGKLRTHEVPRYTQIGNAIPPLFGEQAGFVLKSLVQ